MSYIEILPSIMCADIGNLRDSLSELEEIGIQTLHVDILDGHFSPSMPIGLDIIKQIKSHTKMKCDVHIMSQNNEWFVTESLNLGADAVTFHCETTLHIDRLINIIKSTGAEAGVALNPATSLSVLDYILPSCDNILLMLINPGFAGHKDEKQVPYAVKKVQDLYNLIQLQEHKTSICLDGRVSMETIPILITAGAQKLVAGSTSLFLKGKSLKENKQYIDSLIRQYKKD